MRFVRSLFVGLLLLVSGAVIVLAAKPEKHEEVRWVLAQLDSVDWGEDSPVDAYVANFRARVAEAKAAKTKFGQADYVTEDFTLHNPAYWQAVVVLGQDRILLFWLHGLLLAEEGRSTEAFEWSLLARASVFLDEDFDARWLSWEKQLVTHTAAGKPYRVQSKTRGFVESMQVDETNHMSRVLPDNVPVTVNNGRWVYYQEPIGIPMTPVAGPHDGTFWEMLADQLVSADAPGLSKAMIELARVRVFRWPYISALEADELLILADWLAANGRSELALLCWGGAQTSRGTWSSADFRNWLSSVTTAQVPVARKSSATMPRLGLLMNRAQFGADHVGVHPWLARDAEQLSRRLELYHTQIDRWMIAESRYHSDLTQIYFVLGQSAEMKRHLSKLPRGDQRAMAELRYAIMCGDQETLRKRWERWLKQNQDDIRMPSLYAYAAMEVSAWAEASRAYFAMADDVSANAEHRAFALLHAVVTTELAGESPDGIWERFPPGEIMAGEWVACLIRTLREGGNRSALLAKAQGTTAFMTAGRRCEAHFVLAFAPDATPESRRVDLDAAVATGRLDYHKYLIARYALRDLAKENPAE